MKLINFRIRHKTTKPKDIQKIIFPKDKKKHTLQKYMMRYRVKTNINKLPHATWPAILQE